MLRLRHHQLLIHRQVLKSSNDEAFLSYCIAQTTLTKLASKSPGSTLSARFASHLTTWGGATILPYSIARGGFRHLGTLQ